jgi:hypothetical protein
MPNALPAAPDTRKQRFLELIHTEHWASLPELVRRLDDGGFWDDELMAGAAESFKRSFVRRMVRKIKDDSGWPVVASIQLTQPGGAKVRVYMPEYLFDIEQYRQVIGYWQDRARYGIVMANGYAKRAGDRFHIQLPLPFPETH